MSMFNDPFDPDSRLASGCSCGRHASDAEHSADLAAGAAPNDVDALCSRTVDAAVMRALIPRDSARRRFLKAVGANTALAAVAQFFPLAAAREAFAQGKGQIEKPNLKVGFIPITCGTPIIMSQPMGFFARAGLNVDVVKTAGLGGDPRQDAEQGVRRGPHALADAARDHARRRLAAPFHTRCLRWRTSTARRSRWR